MDAIKTTTQVSITAETTEILKTILLLQDSFAANYLINILRGKKEFLREEVHAEFETFNSLPGRSGDYLRNVIHVLVQREYLTIEEGTSGKLSISEKGCAFLDHPEEMEVKKRDLRMSTYDYMLLSELRKLRKQLVKAESKPAFRIFTDYTLDRIIDEKPLDLMGLKLVPGFGDYKANRFGPAVLRVVQQVMDRKQEDDAIRLLKKIRRPSYQNVKALFESGLSEEEIARKRMVKPQTIRTTLLDLDRAGEIDLRPWIEETVSPEVLEKGSEYFQQAEQVRLKDAYETLGLDYDTLRLCRLYVAKLSTRQDELKVAS